MVKTKSVKETVGAVIVAAGESRRMGYVNKILVPLAKKPLILRTLAPFLKCKKINRIVLVLNRDNLKPVRELLAQEELDERIITCTGGKRRQDSVLAGLKKLGECDWVIIHDGARPLVTIDLIERGLETVCDTGAAIAAVPAIDTIKLAGDDRFVRWTPQREELYLCQTPQIFYYEQLMEAFQYNEHDLTDEAQIIELTGGKVRIFEGSYDNIKITTTTDLVIAEALWKQRRKRRK
jgi:2-C-methyl-D-erythritol 4-phosphate cytidylyltransferase